ncbi:MAG: transcription termination/antitermination protein NusG [Lachnospiraceae bacterium]|nr:transcription termination/antitermination protein NusG [Lachnospiraceae bacterium]
MAESEAKWYVVHTYSGYENKVKDGIESTIANRNLSDEILEVMIPMEQAEEIKDGVTRHVERKMFPGYVLVRMVMNDDTWFVIRNTRGVTGFVGPGSKPVPLSETEMRALGIAGEVEKKISVDFEEGDSVVVIAGVWKDVVSVARKVDLGKQTVTITVDMFGRETPVDVALADVKKLQ